MQELNDLNIYQLNIYQHLLFMHKIKNDNRYIKKYKKHKNAFFRVKK